MFDLLFVECLIDTAASIYIDILETELKVSICDTAHTRDWYDERFCRIFRTAFSFYM